jgi:hypothetical protein
MTTIYVVTGISGAGKDTVSDIIKAKFQYYNTRIIKFAQPVKSFLEHVYDLPEGYLNTLGKYEPCPLPGMNWNDLLVKWWEFTPRLDPYMWLRQTRAEVDKALKGGANIIFNDVRNLKEVEYLEALALNVPMCVIRVWRPGAIALPSDEHLQEVELRLSRVALVSRAVVNNGTLEDLRQAVLGEI